MSHKQYVPEVQKLFYVSSLKYFPVPVNDMFWRTYLFYRCDPRARPHRLLVVEYFF